MMKKINLIIFSIFAIVASFIVSSNVFAFSEGEYIGHDYYSTPLISTGGAVKGTGYATYSMYQHYTYYGDSKYNMYCLDPARKSGGKNANLYVDRVLDQNDPKDAVILAIISDSGYNALEKTMAIRAFIPLNQDLSRYQTITSYEKYEGYANANSGIKWAAEEKEATKAIFGLDNVTIDSVYKISYNYTSYNSSVILNEDNYYVKEARKLFKKALNYGAEIAKGKTITQKKVSYTSPDFTKDYEYNKEKTIAYRDVVFDITFSKFNDGTTDPVNVEVTADTNGKAKAIKFEYKLSNSTEWVTFDSNTDFKPFLTEDSVIISFKVRAQAPVSSQATFPINFKIDTKYKDEKVLTGALLYNSKSSTQRFYIYDEEPGKHEPYTKKLEWPDIIGYCTNDVPSKDDVTKFKKYINDCCRGKNEIGFNITDECETAKKTNNTESINKYCTLKEEYCDYCNTKKTVPETCSEFSEGEFEKGKTATITGPEDIKVCVMDGEDEAKQSYKLTKDVTLTSNNASYSFKNNKYCSVSCKEDYSFDLPTGRYTISGRYFTLQMGVKATKTCYTDMIDYAAFEKDYNEAGAKLKEAIASGNTSTLNTEFKTALDEYNKAVTDIQACSLGWNNNYSKYPEITFDYEEEYIQNYFGDGFSFKPAEDKKTSETKWFCNGSDVDRKYNECIGAKATSEAQTKTLDVIECTSTNATTYSCKTVSKQIPTTKYAKVASTFEATYTPESIFYTKYSTGVIDINKDGNNKYTKLDSYLDSKIDESIKIRTGALPVSLKDGKGVYTYSFKFKAGEYFDKDEIGRLTGGKTSVALVNNDTTFKGTYVCAYIVNCPECKVTCQPDPAKGIFCNLQSEDPEPTECIGTCAFDSGVGELYSVHQTSLTNFNPTGRELGANLTTQKGEALIQSITDKGESIYKEPEYSFTFTPAAISFLRNEVNANSVNGYLGEPSNYEMNCQLYSDLIAKTNPEESKAIKGTDKDYTICQSTVLDALAKIDGVKAHPLEDSRSKISSWLSSDYCKNSSNVCALVGNVGPAWK